VLRGLTVTPFRVFRTARGESRVSPRSLLPSCSLRALQSLRNERAISLLVRRTLLGLSPTGLAFEVFARLPPRSKPLVSTSILSWASFCSRVLPGPNGLLPRLPLLGFPSPSALEVTGSYLHRVCLARLHCASRLSQPPGAFFLPKPCRFFFTPAALLGFGPSEVSPPDPPESLFSVPSPPGVWVDNPRFRRLLKSARLSVCRDRLTPLGCRRSLSAEC